MKELKLEELSVKQKIGMTMVGFLVMGGLKCADYDYDEELEYALEMIRNHSLGAVWIRPNMPDFEKTMKLIKETADYPILIMTDAESGIGGYSIGRHNALGCTGSDELAYTFGKVVGVRARELGYNVVCNPVLDMCRGESICGGNVRSMGGDKYEVARLAKSEARGMHDGGVLTVGKHYPGAESKKLIDSHMAESCSESTVEELLDYNLYPYMELMKENLLDGIMTSHCRLPNIDPDFPASLSEKVIGIIREQGFDGFAVTDALEMMGIKAKFGDTTSKGLAIANGNDLALVWEKNEFSYNAMCETYDQGLITDERLDEAVRRVLEAQHKTTLLPDHEVVTEEDKEKFSRINKDSVYARTDEGLTTELSRDGKHLFVVMVPNGTELNDQGKVAVATFSNVWYQPNQVMKRLEELFPNSAVRAIDQFPTPSQNCHLFSALKGYDDVVWITFMDSLAYVGREIFTERTVSVIEAMQITNQISTIVHFGTPYALENLPHIPRIIIGGLSKESVDTAIEVLAGNYPAKGVLTYDVDFK